MATETPARQTAKRGSWYRLADDVVYIRDDRPVLYAEKGDLVECVSVYPDDTFYIGAFATQRRRWMWVEHGLLGEEVPPPARHGNTTKSTDAWCLQPETK